MNRLSRCWRTYSAQRHLLASNVGPVRTRGWEREPPLCRWTVRWRCMGEVTTGFPCEQPFGRPRVGHGGPEHAVATTAVASRPRCHPGIRRHDQSLGNWHRAACRPSQRRNGRLWTVTTTLIESGPYIVTGRDWTVWVWGLASERQADKLSGHHGPVRAVVSTVVKGRPGPSPLPVRLQQPP